MKRKTLFTLITFLLLGSLVMLPAQAGPPAQGPTDAPRIRLAVGEFDPLVAPEPAGLPSALRLSAYPGDGIGYYLVQFQGPIATADVDALTAVGAEVFDYIPDFAFIVKMNNATRAAVEEMEQVRWVGLYQPAYRLATDLLIHISDGIPISDLPRPSDGRQTADAKILWDDSPIEVIVNIFRGEELAPIIAQIEDMGGVVLNQSQTEWKSKLKVSIAPSRLTDLATIPGVRWIEESPVWKSFNNEAADIMSVREVWDTHGLYGDDQTIAVCDSGLDQGSTSPASLHDDFEDGSGGSRVVAIHDLVGDGASDVNSGHGTHVAGSVLGNGDLSGATPSTHNYPDTAYVGMAPEASLVFQAHENNSTGAVSGVPADLNTLFAQAAGSGANLHTNSWGSSVMGMYTSYSEDVDEYVWDHPNFTILFAAGNDGIDTNADGVIDLYSTGSPGTAKNCITVGASENDRSSGGYNPGGDCSTWGDCWSDDFPSNPIRDDRLSDDPTGMAAFSSRGPTLDGRFKPDLVAPGTNIASVRSSVASGPGNWGVIDANYWYMGGTSMATPLTAGSATIVRQYYTDREGITPSAALIKATLVNGATNIAPGQYGTGATQEIPDVRPTNVAGWGRVNLENSIFPASPRTMLYEDETTGLNTGGSDTYSYTVSSSAQPFRVTLAWSDYPGSPAAAGGLINDLDLKVTGPGGTTYYPNNASQRGASQHLTYDDGIATGVYWWGPGIRVAVRFTPTSYPATLQTGLFLMASLSYPKTFNWYVYDGNDVTGPDTVLASGSTTIRRGGWHPVDLSGAGVTISSGDFFLAIELPDSDLVWAYDASPPVDGRSWDYSGGTWTNWTDNDYMFNAIVKSADVSTNQDRANNLVGIDIESPATGVHTVTVSGFNVPMGPQPYALVASGILLPVEVQPGKIVVNHDEWTLSDDSWRAQPWATTDARQFARNVATWFMGGTSASGSFLVYSTPFELNTGLTGAQLESTMIPTHTWTVISTTTTFSLGDLLSYDGIFLAGSQADDFDDPPPVVPPDTQVLIDYVKAGGNVYLAGGTDPFGEDNPDAPADEAAQWKDFLNACGLEFEPVQNDVDGILKFDSSHPIFAGVQKLFQRDGNSIREVIPSDPNGNAAILVQSEQGEGLYAVCSLGGPIDEVPTAIDLLSFTAEAGADHVTLAWETGTEVDNAGFNLWRSEAADAPYTQLNDALIPAEGDAVSGASYTYTDTDVVKGVTYYYKLEDVDIHGVSTFHGPVSTTPGIQSVYLPLILK